MVYRLRQAGILSARESMKLCLPAFTRGSTLDPRTRPAPTLGVESRASYTRIRCADALLEDANNRVRRIRALQRESFGWFIDQSTISNSTYCVEVAFLRPAATSVTVI